MLNGWSNCCLFSGNLIIDIFLKFDHYAKSDHYAKLGHYAKFLSHMIEWMVYWKLSEIQYLRKVSLTS